MTVISREERLAKHFREEYMEEKLMKDIQEAAKKNPQLKEALDRLKVLHCLLKD